VVKRVKEIGRYFTISGSSRQLRLIVGVEAVEKALKA
jgi:hypothetical protein